MARQTKLPKAVKPVVETSVDNPENASTGEVLPCVALKDRAQEMVQLMLEYASEDGVRTNKDGKAIMSLSAFYARWALTYPDACVNGMPITAKGATAGIQAITVIARSYLTSARTQALAVEIDTKENIDTLFETLKSKMPKLVKVDAESARKTFDMLKMFA